MTNEFHQSAKKSPALKVVASWHKFLHFAMISRSARSIEYFVAKIKDKHFANPNWKETEQMGVYKRGRGVGQNGT